MPLHKISKALTESAEFSSSVESVQEKSHAVKFDCRSKIHEVPSAKFLSRREKAKIWLSNDEFQICREQCKREIKLLEAENKFDIFKFRGLEMIDSETSSVRQKISSLSVGIVIKEQCMQRSQGINDPKAIKKAYQKVTSDNMRKALENAFIDHKSVTEYLSTTQDELEQQYRLPKEKHLPAKSLSRGGVFRSKSFSSLLLRKKATYPKA